MPIVLDEVAGESQALQLAERALGARPLRAVRQGLSESGKNVYRIELAEGQSVVLRTSDRPRTFAFTRQNLTALGAGAAGAVNFCGGADGQRRVIRDPQLALGTGSGS